MAVHSAAPETPHDNSKADLTSGPTHAATSQHYSIKPITSAETLSSLQQDWNRLSEIAESPNVFMTYDWFRAWNQCRAGEHRSGLRRPEVLVLKKDGAVSRIAPLVFRATSRFGFVVRRLESLASPADYTNFVVGSDPAGQIDAIVDYLVQTKDQWDLVDLRSLRETGNVKTLIQRALSSTKLIYRVLPEERCPYLAIQTNWSGIVSKLSRSSRRTLRNQQYHLDRMRAEGLRVRIVEDPQEELGLLEKLVALEAQKRTGGKLMPPFLAKYPQVFQSLFDTLGPRGWIYVALMELGDRLIAWQLGFRCGKGLWDFSKAYDRSFARLSPGTMLIPAVLDYGFSHGYKEYDFLMGEEPYKMTWSSDWHETFRVQIWNRRWISWAHRAWGTVYRLFGLRE